MGLSARLTTTKSFNPASGERSDAIDKKIKFFKLHQARQRREAAHLIGGEIQVPQFI
jgi:hypothetical protein